MISPETIALVRDRTDIVALISESVPTLKRRGRSWVGLCPFHKEKTGSFHVNPDRGFFHCFGCKESGSAIDFVMKHDGATFPEAVRALAERAGVPIEEETRPASEVDRQRKQRDELFAVNHAAATFFEKELREHPHRSFAWDELRRRGVLPSWAGGIADSRIDDAIQAFRIGYAPSGWDGLATFLRQQGISPIAAQSVGLLVPRSSGTGHYDRFRHRLMFAVMDVQGRVIGFSGRALAPPPSDDASSRGEAAAEKPAKYINSPESEIYRKGHALFGLYQARHAIRQVEVVTLVEGNFDVVSLHARGIENVAAPLGTAFTEDQAKLLKRFAGTVVLLFDADAAGQKAVRASKEPCKKAGLEVKVASLPTGKDPDELVRDRGPEALREVVQSARGMLEFLIEGALDDSFGAADAHERVARVEYVKKLLAEENDPLVRSMAKTYADRLAGRLDMIAAHGALERVLVKALEEAPRVPAASSRTARIPRREPGTLQRAAMVGALIEFPDLLDDPEVRDCLGLLEGASARTVAALSDSLLLADAAGVQTPGQGGRAECGVGAPLGSQKTLDTSRFLAQIPPPIQAFASERLAAPHHETREEAKGQLLENAQMLRRVVLGRESSDLARETYKAAGDWQAETELAREVYERVRMGRSGQ